MRAGLLKDRVRVGRKIITRDDAGAEVISWEPIVERMARIRTLTGREYLAADALRAEVTAEITLRKPLDIGPEDRIEKVIDGTIYGVTAVLDGDNPVRELKIMCRVGVDDGR
jgi:SPP1 family predicted phage head-tail adaptor